PLSQAHTAAVQCIAFSNDGRLLASASSDRTATVWDVAAGTPIARIQGHPDGVTWVAFSADDSSLATASLDSTLRTWGVVSGREQSCRRGSVGHLLYGATSSDGVTIATVFTRDADKWDAVTCNLIIKSWEHHFDRVASAAFSPDGSKLASGSVDGVLRIWE
ncbi:hypothetical protein M407DRAFT_41233, partial [Tulasnella calospora MUT 4182]